MSVGAVFGILALAVVSADKIINSRLTQQKGENRAVGSNC